MPLLSRVAGSVASPAVYQPHLARCVGYGLPPDNKCTYTQLFSPLAAEVHNASKRGQDSKKMRHSTALESAKSHLSLLRLLVYQIMGVCCAQKAFYVHNLHHSFVQHLFEAALTMENVHFNGFLVHFLEPYLLHCPPYFHGEAATALNGLLPAAVYRLGVAWSLVVGSVDPLEALAFKHCSLDPAQTRTTPSQWIRRGGRLQGLLRPRPHAEVCRHARQSRHLQRHSYAARGAWGRE